MWFYLRTHNFTQQQSTTKKSSIINLWFNTSTRFLFNLLIIYIAQIYIHTKNKGSHRHFSFGQPQLESTARWTATASPGTPWKKTPKNDYANLSFWTAMKCNSLYFWIFLYVSKITGFWAGALSSVREKKKKNMHTERGDKKKKTFPNSSSTADSPI